MSTRHPNLVAGEWRAAAGDEWLEVFDPADREHLVGAVPAMAAADVEAVFDAARAAATQWARTPSIQRGRILLRGATLLRERRADIARTITLEMGKTLAEATGEVAKAADFFEYYGGLGRRATGERLAHEQPGAQAWTVHEPVGVVLAITPWNDPLLTPARKLAPALIAGNPVVLKPASVTPIVAIELARVLTDAGLPAGVLGTVTGAGASIGEALIDHEALRAVSFTGSNAVGERLRRDLAGRNVKLLAELGGKNAVVVLADADLDVAARTIVAAGFAQAGQRCTATSRIVVERSVRDALVNRVVAAAKGLVLGPGIDGATTMGPVVTDDQRESVVGFIERAVADGADVRAGGDGPGEALAGGCFVQPTVLTGIRTDMEIWVEEVFGPVLTVVEVDGLDEAIAVVNASPYGLAAGVFTSSLASAHAFAERVDAGQVAINLPTSGWDVHMPFGGFKGSGSGEKEQGLEALAFYSRVKTVAMAA